MKWHYFDKTNDLCLYIFPNKKVAAKVTACQRSPYAVQLHTEFKSRVTCLQCLHQLNQQTKRKEQKDE